VRQRERLVRLDELPALEQSSGAIWRPIRRAMALTGIRANAYTGRKAGDEVIEPHDETSQAAGRHEEVYVVLTGSARFTVEGEELDAPAISFIRADVGEMRRATALEDDTTVLVIGGEPGSTLPVAAYEHWYAAEPHYLAGDYSRGIPILEEGLADHPGNPGLNYQLACYHALAGNRDEAVAHLRTALAGSDGRVAGWAAGDADLDPIRNHPDFPEL
jgi:hypothetical protein